MVIYKKCVENCCTGVFKRTTPYGGARYSGHVFVDAHLAALVLNGLNSIDQSTR